MEEANVLVGTSIEVGGGGRGGLSMRGVPIGLFRGLMWMDYVSSFFGISLTIKPLNTTTFKIINRLYYM